MNNLLNTVNSENQQKRRLYTILSHLDSTDRESAMPNPTQESCISTTSINPSLSPSIARNTNATPFVNPPGFDAFRVRFLRRDDHSRGYLKLLSQLTSVGEVSPADFEKRFEEMQRCEDTYKIIVIEDIDTNQVIGAATLLIELKFIHSLSRVGHIEDVVVDKRYRGKRLGVLLMDNLKAVADQQGCYKIILDCSPKNETFYNKAGFQKKEIQMRYDLL